MVSPFSRVPFFLRSIFVGEPSPQKKGQEGTTGKPRYTSRQRPAFSSDKNTDRATPLCALAATKGSDGYRYLPHCGKNRSFHLNLSVRLPSHQLTWKCTKALSKRKVVFLQGSVHFRVSWWEGTPNWISALLSSWFSFDTTNTGVLPGYPQRETLPVHQKGVRAKKLP